MATLEKKADEIAALEKIKKEIAEFTVKMNAAKTEKAKEALNTKIIDLKKQLKSGQATGRDVTAKQLANALLASRKKFLEMTKKDFNGVVKQLAKNPQYAFLRGMSREEITRDIKRKAKPVGWRFKGREDYRTPTNAQVRRGRANGTVYFENRRNRSDVSQSKQLAKGGLLEHGLRVFDEIVALSYNLIFVRNNGKKYVVNLNTGRRLTQSEFDKLSNKQQNELRVMAKGGSTYEDGGQIDINDLEIPVHYTMFEEEFYEYENGGNTDQEPPIIRYYFEDEEYEYAKGGGIAAIKRAQSVNAAIEKKYANWEFPVPPVSTTAWTVTDWSKWIEKHGRKK
jgi:hypothetical protein